MCSLSKNTCWPKGINVFFPTQKWESLKEWIMWEAHHACFMKSFFFSFLWGINRNIWRILNASFFLVFCHVCAPDCFILLNRLPSLCNPSCKMLCFPLINNGKKWQQQLEPFWWQLMGKMFIFFLKAVPTLVSNQTKDFWWNSSVKKHDKGLNACRPL